jgi:ABC-type amino acid transport substrate-binding protein
MALTRAKDSGSKSSIAAVTVVSILALVLAAVALYQSRTKTSSGNLVESSLARTKRTKIIKAGYSNFKPYTILNPNAQSSDEQVTGFCADMLREMAARQSPPWKIEWQPVTFETLRADMDSGRFDVFADAVYQTVTRASEFGLTIPYSYFGVAVGLVKKDESRFETFEDLDREGITIALAEGWTSTEYARQHLKKPSFKLITVGDDPFVQLQEVIAGRADVALQDVPTVLQFAHAHPNEVKALWLDNPPSLVPAGFMTRAGEWEMIHFLNASILALQADGTLKKLDEKWSALSEFPELRLSLGKGLREGDQRAEPSKNKGETVPGKVAKPIDKH